MRARFIAYDCHAYPLKTLCDRRAVVILPLGLSNLSVKVAVNSLSPSSTSLNVRRDHDA